MLSKKPKIFAHPDASMLMLLTLATAIGSVGLAAGGLAGGLLAVNMTGSVASAGLPLGALVLGSAASALIIARLSGHAGRGAGLTAGYAAGALGAVGVVAAAAAGNFPLLLLGSAGVGAANAALFLTRYAAAEVGGAAIRGRALGVILFAASVGAIAGPNLLESSEGLAGAMRMPSFTGLYLVAVPSFIIAGLLIAIFARSAASRATKAVGDIDAKATVRGSASPLRSPSVFNALLLLGAANLVMVATMAVAPVHLTAHSHGLKLVGIIISIHIAGMFVLSPLAGWIVDRAGASVVASLGAGLIIMAGLGGSLADQAGTLGLTVSLALLGLGWSAAVVGASAMLTESVPPALRTRMEGVGEITMGLAAATGAPLAGLVSAGGGFRALSAAGAVAAALALGGVAYTRRRFGRQ